MSRRLPVCSGAEIVRVLERLGYQRLPHRGKGSHHVLRGGDPVRSITVPDHREVKRKTLRTIMRDAESSRDQLIKLR